MVVLVRPLYGLWLDGFLCGLGGFSLLGFLFLQIGIHTGAGQDRSIFELWILKEVVVNGFEYFADGVSLVSVGNDLQLPMVWSAVGVGGEWSFALIFLGFYSFCAKWLLLFLCIPAAAEPLNFPIC